MQITPSTIPGEGTIYRFDTRTGQQFAVLIDRQGGRRLLAYDDDADVPARVVVLDADEADQVAELLHSAPISDRLAALERRVLELTRRGRWE